MSKKTHSQDSNFRQIWSEMDDIDYHKFTVLIAEDDAPSTATRLRAIESHTLRSLQEEGARVFRRYFCSIDAQLRAVEEIVTSRRASTAGSRGLAGWRYQTPDGGTQHATIGVARQVVPLLDGASSTPLDGCTGASRRLSASRTTSRASRCRSTFHFRDGALLGARK